VTAVASRDLGRCKAYCSERREAGDFDVPETGCCGSYEELLQRDDVDCVYVPLPTALHREWTEKAAAAKKHVLCEKPLAPTVADAQAMVSACKKNGVEFMDGVMWVHGERTDPMEEAILKLDPLRVNSHFSFHMKDHATNIRCLASMEPLGSLGDLGWYCTRFALMCFGMELPEKVSGHAETCEHGPTEGVPWNFSATLWFSGGRAASFDSSFGMTNVAQWADVIGKEGAIRVPDFVLPFERKTPASAGESVYTEESGWDFCDNNGIQRVCPSFVAALSRAHY
jgi:predicted dehydrogenase